MKKLSKTRVPNTVHNPGGTNSMDTGVPNTVHNPGGTNSMDTGAPNTIHNPGGTNRMFQILMKKYLKPHYSYLVLSLTHGNMNNCRIYMYILII